MQVGQVDGKLADLLDLADSCRVLISNTNYDEPEMSLSSQAGSHQLSAGITTLCQSLSVRWRQISG